MSGLNFESVCRDLVYSEIGFTIYHRPMVIRVQIGDFMEGFKDSTLVDSFQEAAEWLDAKAREHFPDSWYVTGRAYSTDENGVATATLVNPERARTAEPPNVNFREFT